jgi:pyruvate carboxylase
MRTFGIFNSLRPKHHNASSPKHHNVIKKLLIANRGEIAIRIAHAAASLSIDTVGIYPRDDGNSLHTKKVDQAFMLSGVGTAAYLDAKQIVDLAKQHNCDAIHPGYGFLSENASFALLCKEENLLFVGPTPDQLALFGNKSSAKQLAESLNVPTLAGTEGEHASLEEAERFFKSLPSNSQVVIKALAGGGGKGMRIVSQVDDLAPLMQRCSEEALSMFGSPLVCVEQFLPRAQHIEVQIVGDGSTVCHLFERECTVQRSHQKLIEIAPSPFITDALREQLFDAALKMASHLKYRSLGTFEFLVNVEDSSFYFMETNPRLQVEHTVTEQISGVDLVVTQLHIAQGSTLANVLSLAGDGTLSKKRRRHPEITGCLKHDIKPKGFAIQTRINMEYLSPTSPHSFMPSGGTIDVFEAPSSLGVRVDSFAYAGYQTSSQYDSLLAKLIVHSNSSNFVDAARKIIRALSEFRIEGFQTNVPLLLTLLQLPEFQQNTNMYTRFVDDHLSMLSKLIEAKVCSPKYFVPTRSIAAEANNDVNSISPHDNGNGSNSAISSQTQGSIIEINVSVGQGVSEGQQVAVIEAMKMEHVLYAPQSGTISAIDYEVGSIIGANAPLCWMESSIDVQAEPGDDVQEEPALFSPLVELDYIRPDLAEVQHRHSLGLDGSRPAAVARRHQMKNRTARENLSDLFDPDTFVEYGGLTVAAQR